MQTILEKYRPEIQTLELSINAGVSTNTIIGLVEALIENAYIKGQHDLLEEQRTN